MLKLVTEEFNSVDPGSRRAATLSSIEGDIVYFHPTDIGWVVIEFCNITKSIPTEGLAGEYKLPEECLHLTENVEIQFSNMNGTYYETKLLHIYHAKCTDFDWWTIDYLSKDSCGSEVKKGGLWFLWAMCGLFALLFFFCLFVPMLVMIVSMCGLGRDFLGFLNKLICYFGRCLRLKARTIDSALSETKELVVEDLEENKDAEEAISETNEQPVQNKPKWTWKSMFCLFAAVPSTEAFFTEMPCSRSTLITVPSEQCIRNVDTFDCSTGMSGSFDLNGKGAGMCFQVMGDTDAIGETGILLKDLTISHQITFRYYTSNFKGVYESKHRCPFGGGTNGCDQLVSTTPNPGNQLGQAKVIKWPGVSHCTQGCGNLGCNCWIPGSGKVWSRGSLNPFGSLYKVSSIASGPTAIPEILVVTSDSIGTRIIFEGPWMFTTQQNINGFDLSFLGSLNIFTPEFAGQCLVESLNGEGFFIMPCAPAGAPIMGLIGDIQSQQIDFNVSASPDAFIFDSSLVTLVPGSTSNKYLFGVSAFSRLKAYPVPGPYDGFQLRLQDGRLRYDITQPLSIQARIETSTPYVFRRIIEPVCPLLMNVTASGEYSSQIGSTIVLTAKSECNSGLVMLTADKEYVSLDDVTISLFADEEMQYVIPMRTSEEVNDFELCARDGERISCINVHYVAVLPETYEESPILEDSEGFVIDSPEDYPDFSRFLDRFFGGSLIGFIFTVFGVVLGAGVLFVLMRWLLSRNSYSKVEA